MANILIVEDDELNFELANELLKKTAHTVFWAKNGDECVKELDNEPDLILMDLGLPFEDGFTLTKNIKSNILTRDIPVVAFTAMVMQKDRDNAFAAGCEGFIPKPIDVAGFVSTVESFIKQKNKCHKILVIDDNVMNTEIIKDALEAVKLQVTAAYSGQDALNLIEKEKFDLVLLDIMMPGMSGFDVIRKLKASPKTENLPVVFVSALDSTDDIVKGFNLGSYEYIVKPFKIAELKARVLNILKVKDLQDKLRSEKNILDIIFEFSADGIVLLNANLEIVSCNEIFLKWSGSKKNQILNKNFCEIINYDAREFCANCFEEDASFDFELQENNKIKRVLGVNSTKVLSIQKEIEGYVLVLRDITAQKEIEEQKETFVATLTHDLKTPVRAQIQALQMLLDKKFGSLNASQEEIITETLNSNKYMAAMLDNLLSTYKYDNGNIALHKMDFDINSLIKACYAELRHIAEDKNQSVIFEFSQQNLNIYADAVEIKRVVQNLLYNAISYTQEGGKILVSAKKQDNNLIMSFADNGRGLSESEIASLFNKFTSHAKKFRKVGTGLGLYLSQKIVELHNGTISIKSSEGEGSCFTVELPLCTNSQSNNY